MKNYLVILTLFLSIQKKANSQVVFCPPGAEWHYSFKKVAFFNPPIWWVNEQITYVGDSLLNNETVKVLQHARLFKKYSSYFSLYKLGTIIKQKGDTVFFRNSSTQHTWQILYNFAALPGQGWQNTITSLPIFTPTGTLISTYSVTVDSVKNIMVNSFSLRRLYARYKTNNTFNGPNTDTVCIDERMGCSQYLFNFYNRVFSPDDEDFFNGFLCYSDDTFGTKQFTEKPCNFTDAVGLREPENQELNFKIYPNPSGRSFTISAENELLNGKSILSIRDLSGRDIKQVLINNLNIESYKVDISDISEGVYLLQIKNSKSQTANKRFVIAR